MVGNILIVGASTLEAGVPFGVQNLAIVQLLNNQAFLKNIIVVQQKVLGRLNALCAHLGGLVLCLAISLSGYMHAVGNVVVGVFYKVGLAGFALIFGKVGLQAILDTVQVAGPAQKIMGGQAFGTFGQVALVNLQAILEIGAGLYWQTAGDSPA